MRKPRAIICDDNHQILDILKDMLEMMGYEVLTAETPVTCAFFRDHVGSCPQHHRCTDVLITDNSMPGMTGLELLKMQHHGGCKLTSRNKALMTGDEDLDLRKKVEALGCNFFPKSLLVPSLIAWLKEIEQRVDLSEPLASELFKPAKKKAMNAK